MKILSQGEFREFSHIQCMGNKKTIKLNFDSASIECTPDHEFLRDDGEWVEAKDITSSHTYSGKKLVEILSGKIKPVYDVIGVADTSSFTTNGLEAHNCNFLYIDESAFVENWAEFFSAVFPTISSGDTTKMLFTSTPNGLNHFYKTCEGAKKGTNGFQYVEVPWNRVPGRGDAWLKETLESMDYDYEKFEQEFNCSFQGSSGTLITGAVLKTLVARDALNSHDGLKQYFSPFPGRIYTIIADVSRGKGLDYSAFSVIDITSMPYQQVCVYRNNMTTPVEYAAVIHRVSKLYNNASILVEINDIGGQVVDTLHDTYESESIIYTENGGARGKRISSGFKNAERGVRTTKSVKSVGCSILKLLIEQRQLIIHDQSTIKELSTFSRKGTSYEAESGNNDDLVMGLVLFAWMSDQQYFKELTDINTLMKLRDKSEEDIENELLPFGFVVMGNEDDEVIDFIETPNPEFRGMFF